MPKAILTKAAPYEFTGTAGDVVKGTRLTFLMEDGSVENLSVGANRLKEVGYTPEMVYKPFENAEDAPVVLDLNIALRNGKARLESVSEAE